MSDQHLKQQALDLLKIHYGFNAFRPGQEHAIDSVLDKRSTVVIMPTGGGKSLCYQLPALVLPGVTIVVSPLISLMKDQVDSLNRIGIPATMINSSVGLSEANHRLEAAKEGQYKLIYIAPERFYNPDFVKALRNMEVSLFAVDEAHCISQWGHDFRPSYVKLKQAVEMVGGPTVIALTATATPEVRDDIIKQLGLDNPEVVITGFARPNLQLAAIKASESKKAQLTLDIISSLPDQSGIIYVGTRARVDDILQKLLDNNIEAVSYHGGMEAEDRKWVQDNFMSGQARVIVATNAFGLGIDKKDIRFVIHYDMPGTVEAYYQEAGRAGRDGKQSYCFLLFSPRDRYLQEFFIKGDNPPPSTILELYEILKNYGADKVLVTYSELSQMLHDDVPDMAVGTAIKFLEKEGLIARAHEKAANAYLKINVGIEEAEEVLGKRAKTQQQILAALFDRFQKEMAQGWEVNLEETANIINAKKDSVVRLIKKLVEAGKAEYQPPFKGTEINILKRVETENINIDFSGLQEKMRAAYQKLDQMESYIYHFGCRAKYILDYFGDRMAQDCGRCDNCMTGSVSASGFGAELPAQSRNESGRKISRPQKRQPVDGSDGGFSKLTQLETYELYQQGKDIDAIAQIRNLKPATIVEHLVFLIEMNMEVDIARFVSEKSQEAIADAVRDLGADRLAPIKEMLGDRASWDDIKLVAAVMKVNKNK